MRFSPDASMIESFEQAGGKGKPKLGKETVCYAPREADARKTAYEWWASTAVPGDLSQELPTPKEFEQLKKKLITEEQVAESVACGPDPKKHLKEILPELR